MKAGAEDRSRVAIWVKRVRDANQLKQLFLCIKKLHCAKGKNCQIHASGTDALVAVVGGEAVADGGGRQQVGEEDVRIRGGVVKVVVGVLLDGQGIAKSRNGEEHVAVVEAQHHECYFSR